MPPRVETFSWEEIASFAERLAGDLARIAPYPTVIVGVLRGGALPSVLLSHALSIRRVYAVQIATTASEGPRADRRPALVTGQEGLSSIAPGESIIVVDDVVNTGRTLAAAADVVRSTTRPAALHTAALIWDSVGAAADTECPAEFIAHTVEAWIDFPWEIRALGGRTNQEKPNG